MRRNLLSAGCAIVCVLLSAMACQRETETRDDARALWTKLDGETVSDMQQAVPFAQSLWTAMEGYENWPMRSEFYKGVSPHGAVLRLYYSTVTVGNTPYHVINKDNYGGEGATVERVARSPEKYFAAATVMVQREQGYDPDNKNWFYAKFTPDGEIAKTEKGEPIAGRVRSCIACHKTAAQNDYLFTNDPDGRYGPKPE